VLADARHVRDWINRQYPRHRQISQTPDAAKRAFPGKRSVAWLINEAAATATGCIVTHDAPANYQSSISTSISVHWRHRFRRSLQVRVSFCVCSRTSSIERPPPGPLHIVAVRLNASVVCVCSRKVFDRSSPSRLPPHHHRYCCRHL
jgi:hypothetical protein